MGGEGEQDCGGVALSEGDRTFVETLLTGLNESVDSAAKSAGFYYVDMTESLANGQLQLCDQRNHNRPGLNFIGLRSVSGYAEERYNPANWYHNSLHPNERGHAAMLETFETWLNQYIVKDTEAPGEFTLDLPLVPTGLVRGNAVASEPPDVTSAATDDTVCDLYEVQGDSPECSDEAAAWIAREARDALLPGLWAVIYTLIAGGAWLMSV